MVTCHCSKESEIAEMHTDIKYIRKALEGNGTKGLIEQVRVNTEWRYYMMGAIAVLVAGVSYGIITLR